MLAALVTASLRHRLAVILIWLGIAILGALSFRALPVDAFPDTTPVQVQVNIVAPALSPLDVERQITASVEQTIAGLPGLVEVRSVSRFGFAQVTVIFEDGTDIYLARQVVDERVRTAKLPFGVDPPELGPVATGLGEVLHYVMRSDTASLADVRSAHDWILRPQLRAVPGVAEVNAWGGDELQYQVVVDPLELQRRDLTLAELAEALERNNATVGGGTIDRAGESALVQGVALVTEPKHIEEIVVAARDGVPVRVRDVAKVVAGREIRRGAVTEDARGEVVLGLGFMLMGENSHDVTSRLKLRLDEVKKSLPPGIELTTLYDRTELVDRVLSTVRENLLEGALLVVAVLFVFLGNLRAGLIVAAAIPLSMLVASNLMLRFGIAGSLMSLGAIDFGLLVDSSVIMVENAERRLAIDPPERPPEDVVRDAAIEVRRPTLFGELIIMIVYLPILALEGIEGKLFRPMALTVIFALIGSILLSLTLVPALASLLLRPQKSHEPTVVVRALARGYAVVLAAALRWRWAVLKIALVALVCGAYVASRLGAEFVPRLREGALVANTIRLAGVSVDESVRYGSQIEKELLERFPDEIEHVWTRTGSAEIATDPMGVELSDVFITLTPRQRWTRASTQEELTAAMQADLDGLPGMRVVFSQPIEMRVNEMVAGIRTDIGVKIFGDDYDVLREKAREVEAVLQTIPGAADVVTEQLTGQPMLRIDVDRDAVARYGIAAADVLAVVESLGTRRAGELQSGERRFPITIKIAERYRASPEAIGRILVTSANGERIPLARLAAIETVETPSVVNREWARRRVVVQANVRGRDVGSFVDEARRRIETDVSLPAGYYTRFGGQFENLERARDRLAIVIPLALALVLVLLYATYGRVFDALRVFLGVPFAAVGGVFALALRGMPISVSAAVGFVALFGVAVLGDMMLVSTVRALLAEGMSLDEAVPEAAKRRLRPVLMTALVASLGFVPMAFNTGIGAEVQRPLATVVIGGVISSTILTLAVLPVVYLVLGSSRARPPPSAARP